MSMALRPGAAISRQQQCGTALALAVIEERRPAPGRVGRDGAKKLAQLPGAADIERAIGTPAKLRDMAKGSAGNLVFALVKDEDWNAAEAELAREPAKLVDLLLHRIPHEDERIDLAGARFLARVGQHTRDLSCAPDTGHAAHRRVKFPRGAEPTARLAFAKATIEDELDVQSANRIRRLEHLALQGAGAIPCRLAACRRIEREDEPASPARRLARLYGLELTEESFDIRSFARGGYMSLLLIFLGHGPLYWISENRRQALACRSSSVG
jgi:hypothetical protein